MKQCIRSESVGIRLLSLKVALQSSSASVFVIARKIWYLCSECLFLKKYGVMTRECDAKKLDRSDRASLSDRTQDNLASHPAVPAVQQSCPTNKANLPYK
jgi:hypothetical protein